MVNPIFAWFYLGHFQGQVDDHVDGPQQSSVRAVKGPKIRKRGLGDKVRRSRKAKESCSVTDGAAFVVDASENDSAGTTKSAYFRSRQAAEE